MRTLPGIGVWTSAEVRQRAHGDPDAALARRLPPRRPGRVRPHRAHRRRRRRDARAARAVRRSPLPRRADDRAGRESSSRAAVRGTRRWTIAPADRCRSAHGDERPRRRGAVRSAAGAAGQPTATAPIGSQSAGRSSAVAATSWQNSVLDTHAEPSPSAASATSRFSTPAPMATRNISRSAVARRSSGYACAPARYQARHDQVRRPAQHVAAAQAAPDRRVVEPVGAQVLRPPLGHRVEQAGARRPRLHQHEAPRRRVVRRRRGDGRGHRDQHGSRGRPAGRRTSRTVRRAVTTSRWPRRNMSSSAGRTTAAAPGPSSPAGRTSAASPRTTATGTSSTLPLTRSAAAASSSATATTVCSRRVAVRVRAARGSRRSGAIPATPTAASVRPSRHGRPRVSLTTTATSTPRSSRSRGAQRAARSRRGRPAAARPCPRRCCWRRRRRRPARARAGSA